MIAPEDSTLPQKQFWDKVEPDISGCWLWQGGIQKNKGYGQVKLRGRTRAVHRLSYEDVHGEISKDSTGRSLFWILHHCDVRNCVNSEHLYAGTPLDNARDRVERKGR